MVKIIKNKRSLKAVASRSSGYVRNKFRKIPSLVMFYLTQFVDVI